MYGDPGAEEPHDTLVDYVCHAFPDDAYMTDQFFVGLISVAVALPVDMFLNRAFEIANEIELPETWLEAPPGKWRMVLGSGCHNGWRLADPTVQVRDLVLWLVHERNEGWLATLLRLVAWLWRRLQRKQQPRPGDDPAGDSDNNDDGSDASSESSGAEQRAEVLQKRLYAASGLLGVYVIWAVFSWRVLSGPPCRGGAALLPLHQCLRRFIFTYGALIYRQLGPSAESEFAKTWGIGFALDNATEWQDVLQTAVQTALVVVILDALRLSRSATWFEEVRAT